MKTVKKIIETIQHDVIGTGNRFIAIAWFACLSGLIILGLYLNSETRSFLGVADSREQQVSFEYPVSIKELHVLSGQTVRKGDLMMELDQSELNEKIRLVRAQLLRLHSEKSLRSQLNLIVSNSSAGDLADPLNVDIEDLNEQLADLEEQRKNLFVFAQVDGVVGGVNFRRGEKVPAFTSVLTLSPDSPTYVEGFLHESLRTKLEVGKTVSITPLSSGTAALEGKIVSVGSRIILIPPRLAHYPNMQVYGREVVIEIPPHNGLLLGEKVQIKPRFDFISLPQATASAAEATKTSPVGVSVDPLPMNFPKELSKRFSFEPSGAIYLEDLKKFLVVSDDTDEEKSATLFLVNADGSVETQVLTVPGVKKISDLESISQQDGYIYLLTSQGLNKKGKDKKNRNQMVRVKRSGLNLSDTKVVEFKPLLFAALNSSTDKDLKKLTQAGKDFEIESHFVMGKDLILGLKGPLKEGHAIILKVKDFASLFDKSELKASQVSLWHTVKLETDEGVHRLSDLIHHDGKLYAASVCPQEDCGAIWMLRDQDGTLTSSQIKFFKGVKPEGLAFNTHQRSLMVTFDEKNDTALFAKVEVK
ncbi:hypothetical protein AZI86_01190 [Bdellovibrio bacteriovorus]|uniref:DUF3616 domain-containing protein n=1 Tax=Bdellovibrio bacteriovorus TaxID=959 RepID=A0A150WN49_BDEBC|nr:biotin/lipoyl-binding protein [Bdellovibrio bacteriovorus]KYG65719.1 hypothetical protein AZI86_01190 [Bdellovibrio bacteriovorus]